MNEWLSKYAELIVGPAGANAEAADAVVVAPDVDDRLAIEIGERIGGRCQLVALGEPLRGAQWGDEPAHVIALKPYDFDLGRMAGGPGTAIAPDGRWRCVQTVAPFPERRWADLLFPRAADPMDELWRRIAVACRLDEPDSAESWHRRHHALGERARLLGEGGLQAVRLRGEGTDLTVGLLSDGRSRWVNGRAESEHGARFVPNIPCEEVFTAPDPMAVSGYVKATRPLRLGDVLVDGLELSFEQGKPATLRAEHGVEHLEQALAVDRGRLLGELALVDGESRVGGLDESLGDTLLDENAASHIALGAALPGSFEGDGANTSTRHIDIVVGSPEIEITGLRDGEEVPILVGGKWQEEIALKGE